VRIAVFGLGYVGAVSAAGFAGDGHSVVGVDVNAEKVRLVASGRSPVVEPGVSELMEAAVACGRLSATRDGEAAALGADLSMICVGTPSNGNGSINLQHVESVCVDIGRALARRRGYHVVAVRSTVLPGTVHNLVIPTLEGASGRRAGEDFGVAVNPEFMREGSGLEDFQHPTQTIVGELDEPSGATVEQLYAHLDAPVVRTTIATAEMVKYVNNAFHALKVTFANEVGTLCKTLGIDGAALMEIFCADRRLNISPAYLKPGFAFGGSCLPKDLRALVYLAKQQDVDVPLLAAVLPSNERQLQRAVRLIEQSGRKRVGVLGLSFKAGTDDVRESPAVLLVETLVGRGYQVGIYDEAVDPSSLVGANRAFLDRELPHVAALMRGSLEEVLAQAEVLVIANATPRFGDAAALARDGTLVVDLVGAARGNGRGGAYEGIAW
jgi:GDP-mannose 6-dehydrogenase